MFSLLGNVSILVLKFVECATGRVLKQQMEVQAPQELLAKFASQVAQGLTVATSKSWLFPN